MDSPPLGKPDFGPLERACDSALKSISNSLQGNLPSEASEVLNNLASAIRSQREEVLAVFAKEYAALEGEYDELTSGINRLLEDEFPRLQTQLTAIPSLIEAEEKKAATEAAAKLAAVAKPVEVKPTAFHPGEELIKKLMGMGDQTDSRPGSRVSGNIWENWKKPGQ